MGIPAEVRTSDYTTFAAAITAAATAGYALVVDTLVTLAANETLPTAIPSVVFRGSGSVTFGNYDFVGAGQPLVAAPVQIFYFTGTGRLKGEFQHPWYYPEWNGVVGVDANVANPFTASAPYAAANKIALQYVEDYAAQSNYVVRVQFTKYMTAMNGGITNPAHGICTEWHGINRKTTRVYAPDGNNIRDLWGDSSNSVIGITCYSDLGMFGETAGSAGIAVNVSNACGWTIARRCYFSQSRSAVKLISTGDNGYSENCIVEDCSFDYDCGIPIWLTTSLSGTGSFRGFSVRGRNFWTPGSSSRGSADTFCLIQAPGSIPYNWEELGVTITPSSPGRNIYVIDNQSNNVCNLKNLFLDGEFSDANYNIVIANPSGSLVTSAGGPSAFSGPSFQFGKFIWNANIQGIDTSRYLLGGQYNMELVGAQTFSGNFSNSELRLITPGSGGYMLDLLLRTVAGGSASYFTARARLFVAPDSGDGFASQLNGYVFLLSNTGNVLNLAGTGPFDLTNFSVGSDGIVRLTANFGGLTVKATGSVTLAGLT